MNFDDGQYNQKRYRIGEFIQWVEATRKGKDFWNPEVVSDWGSLHKESDTAFNRLTKAIPDEAAG